jgi:hypothetical protein
MIPETRPRCFPRFLRPVAPRIPAPTDGDFNNDLESCPSAFKLRQKNVFSELSFSAEICWFYCLDFLFIADFFPIFSPPKVGHAGCCIRVVNLVALWIKIVQSWPATLKASPPATQEMVLHQKQSWSVSAEDVILGAYLTLRCGRSRSMETALLLKCEAATTRSWQKIGPSATARSVVLLTGPATRPVRVTLAPPESSPLRPPAALWPMHSLETT